jgi:enoyl-CoA hydratase/carnithine racemase
MKITTEQEGNVVVLELDHGKANEMGRAEVAAIEELTHLLEQPAARALVTYSRRRTAKGTPVFVSGANVAERADWPDELVKTHVSWQRDVLARLRRAPVFHVVVVDGVALGWGTEFLLTADWRIACDSAQFGLPETGLGIVPGAGGTTELWMEIGVAHALRLGMTGDRIGADEALAIGLVQERAATVDLGLQRARSLCASVLRRSPTAVAEFKRALLASVGRASAARAELEHQAYVACVDAGEAAIGRASFDAIRAGETPAWGPRTTGSG